MSDKNSVSGRAREAVPIKDDAGKIIGYDLKDCVLEVYGETFRADVKVMLTNE